MKSIGRITPAPCGHPGEVIIGNFVACSVGCGARSGKPAVKRASPAFELVPRQGYRAVTTHTAACTDPTPYTDKLSFTWCTGCGCRL